MKASGYGFAVAVIGLLRLTLRALVMTGELAVMLTAPIASWCLHRVSAKGQRPARATAQEVAPIAVQPHQHAEAPTSEDIGSATIICANDFEVADRLVSIRLEPPVGVINLRIYNAAGVVKRDLIVSEPCLRTLMKGRRHNLPDVPYDRVAGLDQIKDDTIEMVEKLINDLGNRAVRVSKPRKDDLVRSKSPVATAPAPVAQEPAAAAQKSDPPMTKVVAPRVTTGFTYVGKLMKAGAQNVEPKGRQSYEVFEATLQLDNGAELALRGAELERELTANGCTVGQRVAITPMGKVPVTLANGGEGAKNLYSVRRMGAPSKG